MNFYALNETPINGWAAQQGFGQVAMSLAGSGVSANVGRGGGFPSIVLQASGDGTRRAMGGGFPSLILQVAGDGTRRVPADGIAVLELGGDGEGRIATSIGGHATMMLTWPSGQGGVIARAHGTAAIELVAKADGRAATGRHGFSDTYLMMLADGWMRHVPLVKGGAGAEMWLYLRAVPRLVAKNGSALSMALRMESSARIGCRVLGDGAVVMALELLREQACQYRLVNGSGVAAFGLACGARDLRIVTLPSTISPAPTGRGIRVSREPRGMRVARAARTEYVGA
ncbi:hypothetical protein [Burkholderia mayonis]|uniref:Uncharacterized protein n=1 Tax=Burkholderia mayonis TaxID=1385591 RepID=A0A1B4G151_9BURK|nr:hypothetical protein [Burkholderia mayonis]AOJ09660.1 hypothetical protein WS71_20335 [Burkholderia mayonis]KVE52281.1 hypothetical protein WS71_10160 [Burkholderia mayonis]